MVQDFPIEGVGTLQVQYCSSVKTFVDLAKRRPMFMGLDVDLVTSIFSSYRDVTKGVREVQGLTLLRNEIVHDLLSFLPTGYILGLGYETNTHNGKRKIIEMKEIDVNNGKRKIIGMKEIDANLDWFCSLLHEIGHAHYYPLHITKFPRVDVYNRAYRPEGDTPFAYVEEVMACEYTAWEYALQQLTRIQLDQSIFRSAVYPQVHTSVQGYIDNMCFPMNEYGIIPLEVIARDTGMNYEELRDRVLERHRNWIQQYIA